MCCNDKLAIFVFLQLIINKCFIFDKYNGKLHKRLEVKRQKNVDFIDSLTKRGREFVKLSKDVLDFVILLNDYIV